ncbi:MAG TPA: Ig-like domain-containing protein, partial [Candidatus Marinimicrobia bacterium]|nr:Ig-like domain-containing protein [Candidatus Neomarinimicrobiota bacterium]
METSDFALSISGGTATVGSTPSSISISGNVYTLGLTLTGTPDGSETLTVVPSSSTAIYDGVNNAASTTQSNNTVALADETAPTVSSLSPADGATGVATTANLVITFDEAVDAETGNITLYKSDDTQIQVFDVTSDISGSGGTAITIDPTAALAEQTSYYVHIDATAFDD